MASNRARPVNALVTESLKKRHLLEKFVAQCGPWSSQVPPREDIDELRLVLAHEALFGRGLRQPALLRGASEDPALGEALQRIRAWEATTLKAAKAAGRKLPSALDVAASSAEAAPAAARELPRYARVNTLKASVDDVVATLCTSGWRLIDAPTGGAHSKARGVRPVPPAPPAPPCFWKDPHLEYLLCFPPHTELQAHALVASSQLILQDKASCFAPAALAPEPGELILDCCAAPGNKTTQLAALSAPGGKVIACERDTRRAGVLRARSAEAAGTAIEVVQTDFLSIDPSTEPYCRVSAVQLDPTCSGSGMVERAGFQLLDVASGGPSSIPKPTGDAPPGLEERLTALATMQLGLLRHALAFPSARVVVYSTCSVHPVENELVVNAALSDHDVKAAGWRLAPALTAWPFRGLPLIKGAEMLGRAGPEVQTNGFFFARFERKVKGAGGGAR